MFLKLCAVVSCVIIFSRYSRGAEVFFEETFEDADFAKRGWYDVRPATMSREAAVEGSTQSIKYHYAKGSKAVGGMRRMFPGTESVYIRYYVKYSDNWVGSQRNYHPHEFLFMTNKDDRWAGPAYSHLTTYVEQLDLRPRLAVQDGKNIDLEKIGKTLVGVTENRAIAGGNGDSDGHGGGHYRVGKVYWNGKCWVSDDVRMKAGQWHKVETLFKLNSINEDGIGVADGVMKYWLDGKKVMDYDDIMFRTGRHPDMKFDKLLILPWIGDGSPIDQTMWVDNLMVASDHPESEAGSNGDRKQSGVTEPLPEGNTGIASRYPGDAGIEKDSSVVFVEMFDVSAVADLKGRWDEVGD